jgi:hypothetical protein
LAKLPKFGEPEGTSASNEKYTLPEFTAPAPVTPKTVATKIAQKKVTAPKVTAPSATQNKSATVTPAGGSAFDGPILKPIISAASAVINTLGMPLAWFNGYEFATADENNKGIITTDDLRDAAAAGRKINGQEVKITGLKNGQPVYNIQPTVTDRVEIEGINARRRSAAEKNTTAWTKGEQTLYGSDVAAASGADTTPGNLGLSEADVQGLLNDIATDPLNFVPFGAIGTGVRAVTKGTSGAYKALKLTMRKEIGQNTAKLLGMKVAEDGSLITPPLVIPSKTAEMGPKVTEKVDTAKKLVDEKYTYKTNVIEPGDNGFVKNFGAVVGSGLEAGYKAMAGSLVRSNLDSFLRKYQKADLTITGKPVANIVRQGEGDYRIVSGNGVELDRATTKVEAKELANARKAGISGRGMSIATANDTTKALEAVESEVLVDEAAKGAPTAKLPAEANEDVAIEAYTPYQAKDGKWWVYDGEKVYKVADEGAATRLIDALQWTESKLEAAVVTKKGKGYQVRAGEQIFPAKTKAEADAIATAYNEQTLPSPVISAKGQAVVDTAPSPLALADILKVPATTEEGKALKAVLSKLDKASAKATGTKALYKGQVKERIQDIIRSGEALQKENAVLSKVPANVVSELKDAIKGAESNPFVLYEIVLKGNPLQPLIGNLPIKVGADKMKYSTIVAKSGNWKAGNPSAEIKNGMEAALAGLVKRIETVKATGVENLGPQQKYELIKAEFGEVVAEELKATGILETFTTKEQAQTAVKSFYAVIDGLLEKAATVKFTGIEDLISQVKNNSVVIDEDSLKQIFKLIDPNNSVIASVEDAATKDAAIYAYNELFKSEGVKTIRDMQIQLTHLGDFDNLLSLSGISDDTLLAQLIKDLRNPDGSRSSEFVSEAVVKESKQQMALRISEPDNREALARALEGIAEANAETYAKLQNEILVSPEAQIDTIDTFGKIVSRSTKEQYAEGSVAIQTRTWNQVRERKLFNVVAGITRSSLTRGGKALNRIELMDETIKSMNLASDALGLMDIRITSVKFRADEDFVSAFEKAKSAKKKFDFSKDGNFAYLHMGDIMKTFKETDATNLILDSFFPPSLTSGKPPKNYLSIQGFSDATRQALELHSKGKAIDVENLTQRILSGGLDANKYSPAFKAKYKDLARQLAEHLARQDVLEALSNAHLTKSLGVAERWVNSAESVGKDLERLLYEAWELNFTRGDMDDMTRVEMIRSHMRKVLYATDIFRIEGGPIAESAIKAISNMMLKRGLIRTPDSVDEVTKLLGQEEAASFRKVINTMYLYEKPQFAMKPGQTKFATEAQIGKIQNRLVEAEENYATVMKRADDQFSADPKVRESLRRDRTAAQAKLDKARLAAVEAGLSTRHYSSTKGWVPSDKFNFEAETRAAQRRLLNYQSAKAGLKAREDFIMETRPVMPKATILTGKRRDEFLKKENARLATVHLENAGSRIANANEKVEKLVDNRHYENLGATEAEAAEMYFQRSIAEGFIANTHMDVEFPGEAATLFGETMYRLNKEVSDIAGGVGQISERFYGLSQARKQVADIMRRRETMYHKNADRYANVLRGLSVTLRDVEPQLIEDAFDLIKRGELPGADAAPNLVKAYAQMERAWKPLIASVESAISTQRGYNGDMLAAAMQKMGLNEADGFSSPAGLTATELPDWYRKLPFGKFEPPVNEKTGLPLSPDTEEYRNLERAYNETKEALSKKQASPLITMLRMMQASQNVIYQKGLAEDFISRFGYKAEGLTYAQAIDKGYVKLQDVYGGESLLKYLPTPENGGLVPPELGKNFFSLMRQYNAMFESATSKAMQDSRFETMMTVVGGVKAMQTIMMPRHHITNLIGDISTALVRGVSNPLHWGTAARLSTKFALRRAGAEYFIPTRLRANGAETMERLFSELTRSFGAEGRALQGVENGQNVTGIVLYKGGKPTRVNLSDDDITNLFEDWGVIEESIYQQDTQGLVDYLDNTGLMGSDATLGKKISQGLRTVVRKGTKLPGDFAAGYGNIPRTAHALKLLHSRSWSSIEEAMSFISNEIALFHPTAKSLAASERQWGRFVTTYYTWMRMAHVGMFRMIAENTRTVAAIQKVMFEFNRDQLGEDNRPINAGVSYGGDVNKLPAYVTSTAGATRVSGENLQGFLETTGLNRLTGNVPEQNMMTNFQLVFPLMYNDVFNFSKIDFDPYRDLEGEIVGGIADQPDNGMNGGLGSVLGKNISLIGEPIVTLLYGKDPATGKDVKINGFGDFVNQFVGSNIPQFKLLQTLNDPNIPEDEKFAVRFKALIGLGFTNPNTDSNKKNAVNQFNTRTKDFLDSILKQEGLPDKDSLLYQRLTKVVQDKAEEGK